MKFYCMDDLKMEYSFIIAVSHMSLMDPASTFYTDYTILKYPLNEGYSDVTIINNLVGEEEIFLRVIMRVILGGLLRDFMRWASCIASRLTH